MRYLVNIVDNMEISKVVTLKHSFPRKLSSEANCVPATQMDLFWELNKNEKEVCAINNRLPALHNP